MTADTCALCGEPVDWRRDHLTLRGAGAGARTLHVAPCAPRFDARQQAGGEGQQPAGDVRPAEPAQATSRGPQQAHLPRPQGGAGDLFGAVPSAQRGARSVLHRSRMAQAPLGFSRNDGGETR